MTEQHPITPPPELVQRWNNLPLSTEEIITIAWRHGADQELEACCQWLQDPCCADMPSLASDLRYSRRRPKPPSLAEEALATLHGMRIEPCVVDGVNLNAELQAKYNTIRRALERLQELEGGK